MPINTDQERNTLSELSAAFDANAEEYCRRMNTLALLEILDELRAIRAAAVNPLHKVEPQRTDRRPGEPTEDEIRLYEILVDELFPHGTRLELNDGIAIVRAIIDGIRPMTDRQWEALPGLGKPWKDLSSGEVWQCFLESISPKREPAPAAPPDPYPDHMATCQIRMGGKCNLDCQEIPF